MVSMICTKFNVSVFYKNKNCLLFVIMTDLCCHGNNKKQAWSHFKSKTLTDVFFLLYQKCIYLVSFFNMVTWIIWDSDWLTIAANCITKDLKQVQKVMIKKVFWHWYGQDVRSHLSYQKSLFWGNVGVKCCTHFFNMYRKSCLCFIYFYYMLFCWEQLFFFVQAFTN